MSIRRKRQIIRKHAAVSGRQAVTDPFRPRPTKTELREQAVEAVASRINPHLLAGAANRFAIFL